MAPDKASSRHAFIILTSEKKVDLETRKRIRSHVMQGRTHGKNQYGKPRRAKLLEPQGSSYDRVPIPPKVGSDLAFTPLPGSIEPQIAVDTIKSVPSIMRARYALGSCLIFTDNLGSPVVREITADALSFQSMIMMAEAYFDFIGGRNSNYPSQMHLKTIQLLLRNLSLEDEKSHVSDATIFAICNLMVLEFISGDVKSVKYHLEGISKIIDLRGGLSKLTHTKLVIDLFKCDIGWALHTGAYPLFSRGSQSLEAFFPYPEMTRFQEGNHAALDDLDINLAEIWNVMRNFCSVTNLVTEAQGKITWEQFLNMMTSVMYPLLQMRFHTRSVNEAIRCGLLGLGSHIFLQGTLFNLAFTNLNTAYKIALDHVGSLNYISPALSTWLLMVGAVSIFKEPDYPWLLPRLRENVQYCGIESWEEMQKVLSSFMWIHVVLDRVGKDVFDSVSGSK